MKTYFLRLKHIEKPDGRPLFRFVRGNKIIFAVSDDLASSKVYADDIPIPEENLVEFTATDEQMQDLELITNKSSKKRRELLDNKSRMQAKSRRKK